MNIERAENMEVKAIEDIFIKILRSELTETELDDSVKEQLTPDVISALYSLADRHDLAHIIYFSLYKCGLKNDDAIYTRFDQKAIMSVYRNEQMKYAYALAAAGGAQQRHGLIRRLELRPEVERPQPLLDVHIQAHFAALLPPTVRKSRFSSMFTASSTTAEMADHHVITSRMPKVSSTHAPMSRFGPRTRRMR